ncbi:transposase [Nonomuraea muscovyensis]|uniref:Transposase n=1 Tax=Nonomuraea muscovyensis TaxID=1124761 RepID=A0A7X0C6V2_9ACTN|nr:transposase [Nonomuraea muscovyensis]
MASGPFAPGHLGELTQLVPFEMVDEALKQTGRVRQRVRDLPSRVAVYLVPKWTKRQRVDGIRWRMRTGAPWRDVPARYGKWETV